MRVKLKCDRVEQTPDGFGREYQPTGTIIDVPDKEGYTLIQRGAADPMEVETAALQPSNAGPGRPRKG